MISFHVLIEVARTGSFSGAAARQELAGLRDRVAGRLVVGGYPTAMASLIPRALARLLDAHPAIRVRLAESSTPRQLTALRRGRLEVAVVATGEGLPKYGLDGLRLTELRGGRGIGLAVAESHPFAARSAVDPDELANQRWVVGDDKEGSPQFGTWPDLENPIIAFAVRRTTWAVTRADPGPAATAMVAALVDEVESWSPAPSSPGTNG